MNHLSPVSNACEILLVRHGRTAWNLDRRRQSHRQVPLDEVGRAMAAALANSPVIEGVEAIYTSDLARAMQTAEPVARKLGLPVHGDMRLREVRGTPAPSDEYENLPFPVERETNPQVRRRAVECLEQIADNHPGQRVMVVSHGGTMKEILKMICGDEAFEHASNSRPKVTNTGINHILRNGDGQWSIARWWDIDHLADFDLSVVVATDSG